MREQYIQFLKDHSDYAAVVGYNFSTERGIREAMADYFLYEHFLVEYEYEQKSKDTQAPEQIYLRELVS